MKASGSGSDAGAGGRGSRSVIPVCGLLMCFLKSVSWNLKAFRGGLGEELSQTRLVGAPVGAVGEFHARNQRQSRWQFHSESHAPPNFGVWTLGPNRPKRMPKRPQTNPNPNHTKTQYSVPPLESEEKNLGPWIKLTATGTDFPKPKPKHEF